MLHPSACPYDGEDEYHQNDIIIRSEVSYNRSASEACGFAECRNCVYTLPEGPAHGLATGSRAQERERERESVGRF
eukprot:COSAG06_NODE_4839_length_3918_cov_1.490966_1_plen_76_part_00